MNIHQMVTIYSDWDQKEPPFSTLTRRAAREFWHNYFEWLCEKAPLSFESYQSMAHEYADEGYGMRTVTKMTDKL